MNSDSMTVKRLNLTVPPETEKKLKELCEVEDRKPSNIVKRLIEAEYEKIKKGK